ncbi:hypothetical protein AZL_a06080 (plasmid) [Azospirillum sp. B510]|nr:hypothetical protein AZL_a06080 [Azospirillum sp. B510]
MGQRAALYCRVSTADQSCARQERDLLAFAARADYQVVGVFKGRSYRLIGRELGLSKNTVTDIVKRHRDVAEANE